MKQHNSIGARYSLEDTQGHGKILNPTNTPCDTTNTTKALSPEMISRMAKELNLESVSLPCGALTAKDVEPFLHSDSIQSLDLRHNQVNDDEIALKLAQKKTIKQLGIIGNTLKSETMDTLRKQAERNEKGFIGGLPMPAAPAGNPAGATGEAAH